MSSWSIYLLSNGSRTYVGATTDVARRLRQHNGEIVGGARSTRGHKWKLMCAISGFPNQSSAYRWEKLVKSRCRGVDQRYTGMFVVFTGGCPYSRRNKTYTPPSGLSWHGDQYGAEASGI